jgi:putative serine protease PepD
MTESNRYSGEPQYPHDPQLPLYYGPQATAQQAPVPQGAEPLQSALPATQGTQTLDPFGAAPAESAGDGDDDFAASGFPPPPPYDPAPPSGDSSPHRRRKAGRPLALFAAVALVAGAIGGGAGALVGNATAGSNSSTATTSSVVNAAAIDGSVAGVAKADSPSVVEITATSSVGEAVGSGVIITSDGQIVTNNHVITGATAIKVTYSDGKTATATVVGADTAKDLALIKVSGASGLTPAALGDSSTIAVGDQVVAIGSPEALSGTVTSGIVSALNRDVTVPTDQQQAPSTGSGGQQWPFSFGGQQYNGGTSGSTTTYKAIQTDASLNPGNSGGALINMSGQVIGINSAMYSASSSSSTTSAGSVGLGFAIPINTVKSDLSYLQSGGDTN